MKTWLRFHASIKYTPHTRNAFIYRTQPSTTDCMLVVANGSPVRFGLSYIIVEFAEGKVVLA
jgi:hypothetical protein